MEGVGEVENPLEKRFSGEESLQGGEETLGNESREVSEKCGGKTESDSESSPRGVLERRISGSDSDHGSFDGSGSFRHGELVEEENVRDANSRDSNWKKLIKHLKRRSSKKFSTIPLFRRKLGRNRCNTDEELEAEQEQERVDCGDFVVPKPSWRNFTYEELQKATDDFSTDNVIGSGGHAKVYKGSLPDGQIVAVKKMIKAEKSDEERIRDFLTELGITAHIDHQNTAKLIGFSADNGLHLVLKFCPHGSLASALHASEIKMDWKVRYKVAIGVAEGLKYLHYDCQRRIIHRDITASNILLEEDYNPQISDYGLAKWLPERWLYHRVSPIEGTFGYMAPEYFMNGIVNEKTDVFAFGVLLLELITGRRSVDSSRQSLVMWAKPLLEQNKVKEIIDPCLGEEYDQKGMKRAMHVASMSIYHVPNMRPDINRVLQVLKGEKELLVDVIQNPTGTARSLFWDACDMEDYTSTTYLKDLDRHKELIME